jgi:SAM-dependent methyltransferase
VSQIERWDRQIRLFAAFFLRHANLPAGPFTLLDVGCGTGSAAAAIKRRHPEAAVSGCDVSAEVVELARGMNGRHAAFFRAGAGEVTGRYDVLYLSNILEHLEDWPAVVDRLLGLCGRMYVLVPYREPLPAARSGIPYHDHVVSFDRDSFSHLQRGPCTVEQRVIRTPNAWGHTLRRETALRVRSLVSGEPVERRRELLVAVTTAAGRGDRCLPARPFVRGLRRVARVLGGASCA